MSEAINKQEIINEHKAHEKDTGSSEVQVAILTARISHLTGHLKIHRKDFHTRKGLVAMTNRRRKLLSYIKKKDLGDYQELIKKLNIRR